MTSPVTNPFGLLPPAPAPPNDPTWWPLDGRVGWHDANLEHISLTGDNLGLLVVAGSGRQLNEPSGSFGGLVLPANVAQSPDGSLYLLDALWGKLKRFDPCQCEFQTVPCIGGVGREPRQVQAAHAIGICSGNLFVCDTGNHRLLVFSIFGFVLRDIWQPPASTELTKPWEPHGVAFDGRGIAYVSDPANGCIHQFSPRGRWLGAQAGFGGVRWIAFDCKDRLYAVVERESSVRIVDRDGKLLGAASRPDEVAGYFPKLDIGVDARGDLDLSTLCTSGASPTVFSPDGSGLVAPPPDPPSKFETSGRYWSKALDSNFYRCQWHRIVIRGTVPRKSAIRISTFTSEMEQPFDLINTLPDSAWATSPPVTAMAPEFETLISSSPGRYLWLRLDFSGDGSASPRIEGIKLEFPRITLRRYLPAVFAEDAAGAAFTDRFLSIFDTTFRSIESKIDNEAAYFDPLSAPADAPKSDFLSFLASWIGISLDRHMPVEQRRRLLKQAGCMQSIGGTKFALWKQLLLLLGMEPETVCCHDDQPKRRCVPKPLNCAPPQKKQCAWQPPELILENYQLRRWLFLGAGRLGDDAMLWGRRIVNRSQLSTNAQAGVTKLLTTPDPLHDPFLVYSNKFTVFVPARLGAEEQKKRTLLNLLEAEKPAHTQYHVEYVEPRMRIGFQAMIGLDSVVGRYPSGFTFGQRLGEASLLRGVPLQGGPSYEIGRSSRIGTSKLD